MNSFVGSELSTTVRNNAKEMDKIQQLKQWAFSAAQNGDLDSALAAITGDNVAAISDAVKKFSQIKQQHEEQMKQMDQAIQEQANQLELQRLLLKVNKIEKHLRLKHNMIYSLNMLKVI